MKLTLKARFLVLISLLTLVAITFGVTAFIMSRNSLSKIDTLQVTGLAIRQHMDGDMMHEALRGTVHAALLAGRGDEVKVDRNELQGEVRRQAGRFREQVAANLRLPLPPEILAAIQRLEQPVRAYTELCERVTNLAFTDRPAALREYRKVETDFAELEKLQDTTVHLLLAENEQARAGSARAGELFLRVLVITFGIAGVICCFFLYKIHTLVNFMHNMLVELDRTPRAPLPAPPISPTSVRHLRTARRPRRRNCRPAPRR
jgi:hypothetical protein